MSCVLQGGGVLLACTDVNTSSAAAPAVATACNTSTCLNLLQPTAQFRTLSWQGLPKARVAILRRCSHAVIVVEGLEPPALLPVFINTLSEHGRFEDSGTQVPAYKPLVVATTVMLTASLQQVCASCIACMCSST